MRTHPHDGFRRYRLRRWCRDVDVRVERRQSFAAPRDVDVEVRLEQVPVEFYRARAEHIGELERCSIGCSLLSPSSSSSGRNPPPSYNPCPSGLHWRGIARGSVHQQQPDHRLCAIALPGAICVPMRGDAAVGGQVGPTAAPGIPRWPAPPPKTRSNKPRLRQPLMLVLKEAYSTSSSCSITPASTSLARP